MLFFSFFFKTFWLLSILHSHNKWYWIYWKLSPEHRSSNSSSIQLELYWDIFKKSLPLQIAVCTVCATAATLSIHLRFLHCYCALRDAVQHVLHYLRLAKTVSDPHQLLTCVVHYSRCINRNTLFSFLKQVPTVSHGKHMHTFFDGSSIYLYYTTRSFSSPTPSFLEQLRKLYPCTLVCATASCYCE